MEAKLWRVMYHAVTAVAHARRRRRERFDDRAVALTWLWAVLHERPACWACDPRNWPASEADRPRPSPATLSRRLRTVGVLQLLERVGARLSDLLAPAPPLVKAGDSKPLYVGASSKDADARRGRVAAGQFARGYRLHALTHGRAVRHWTLAPMNAHDASVAPALLAGLEGGGGYVVLDNAYDANALHALAAARGHQLVAPARAANRGVRDTRHNGPPRLRSLDLMHCPLRRCAAPGDFGRALYACRAWAESCSGELTMMGLHYLPAWVRGPRRVALWVSGKILFHLCRCVARKGLTAMVK